MYMNARQRLQTTLSHEAPDRLCVDFGSTNVSGIAVSTVSRLRRAVLGDDSRRVKIIEPFLMLGEVDDELRRALGIDVRGVFGRRGRFGVAATGWKELELFDGTLAMAPDWFNPTVDANGDWLLHPGGDKSAPPSARMPKGGFYFDAIIRQMPIDDAKLNPQDNLEEFGLYAAEDVEHLATQARQAAEAGWGVVMSPPGLGFGDISHVPGVGLAHPKGIRDVEEWYVSLLTRPDYIYQVFEGQCRISLKNLDALAKAVGANADVVVVSGTDFGSQRGPLVSPRVYRDLFKPFHKRLNAFIHANTPWKTFIHSCGSVVELIPDFIEAGFDILNPVQTSAAGMDPAMLKREFGRRVVFWGGGVDTQKTLPFGTPDEVYREVRDRIAILGDGGGFVFNSVHCVQANTPVENLLAMFRAIRDANG